MSKVISRWLISFAGLFLIGCSGTLQDHSPDDVSDSSPPGQTPSKDSGSSAAAPRAPAKAGDSSPATPAPSSRSNDPPEGFTNTVGMKFKLIPHDPPFYMGVYEVTQEQYQQIMGENPSVNSGAQNPVEEVSWNDAVEFCRRLSKKEKRTYRLPTSAEWEFACRAGTTTNYSFGDDESELGKYAWFGGNASGTHPVGQKLPNPWGLHDMHGNVWEWCQDLEDLYRVIRGGGYLYPASACRSSSRDRWHPSGASSGFGFRLVAALPSKESEAK